MRKIFVVPKTSLNENLKCFGAERLRNEGGGEKGRKRER